eukprot:7204224-Prymnesium_polylepis.1
MVLVVSRVPSSASGPPSRYQTTVYASGGGKRFRPPFFQPCRCPGSPLTLRPVRADRSGMEVSLSILKEWCSLISSDLSAAQPTRTSSEQVSEPTPHSESVCSAPCSSRARPAR